MTHEKEEQCPACAAAARLGLDEGQTEIFHGLVHHQIETLIAMSDLEDSGVELDRRLEVEMQQAIDESFADEPVPKNLLN